MIISFADKWTAQVFGRTPVKRFGADVQRQALRKLIALHLADDVNELRFPPGNRLDKLAGDRTAQYNLRINDQWRLCFVWKDGNAHDVEIADYH
jgi:toxin HigB-1